MQLLPLLTPPDRNPSVLNTVERLFLRRGWAPVAENLHQIPNFRRRLSAPGDPGVDNAGIVNKSNYAHRSQIGADGEPDVPIA